jgi:hypothetical protein
MRQIITNSNNGYNKNQTSSNISINECRRTGITSHVFWSGILDTRFHKWPEANAAL